MFLGDWHNNRASLNIVTLNYSLQALEHMNANFQRVYFIPGNHDLYYRDKRDIQSVEWAKHLPNVEICNDWSATVMSLLPLGYVEMIINAYPN
jgi:UDP-2,3-diacylglucosamine pyrophosphatase LpxH